MGGWFQSLGRRTGLHRHGGVEVVEVVRCQRARVVFMKHVEKDFSGLHVKLCKIFMALASRVVNGLGIREGLEPFLLPQPLRFLSF